MKTRGFAPTAASAVGTVIDRVLSRGLSGAATRLLLVVVPFGLAWFLLTVLVDPAASPTPAWVASLRFPLDLLAGILTSLFAPSVLLHLLPVAAGGWLGMRLAAHYLDDVYALGSVRMAGRYLRSAIFGVGYDTLVVSSGDAKHLDWTSTLLRIGGPGWLSVHLGFAAAFETLEGHPRVYGPAPRRFLHGFERLRDVVDLRDQLRRVDEARAVTRDGVEVQARDAQMVFRVHSGNQPRNLSDPYPYTDEAIRRLVYGQPVAATGQRKWSDALPGLVQREITRFISDLTLEDFLAMQPEPERLLHGDLHIPRQELTDHFRTDTLRHRLQDTGLELDWVGVGTWEIRGAGRVRADELVAAWQGSHGATLQPSLRSPGFSVLDSIGEAWRAPAASPEERMRRLIALAYEGLRQHTAMAMPENPPERDPILTHLARLLAADPSGRDS
jgi:hypothetical protein